MKRCHDCHQEKPKSEFYVQRRNTKTGKEYHYSKCKVCSLKDCKNRYETLKDYKYKLKKKYGLSWEEYLTIYNLQQGKCSICSIFLEMPGNTNSEKLKAGVIDHDHISGNIRGILCSKCNIGIGQFQDNSEVLLKASLYLKLHNEINK